MHDWDDLINKRKLRVSGLDPNNPPTLHSRPRIDPRGAFSRLTGGGVRPVGQFGPDQSFEYPHDIHVGDPSKNPGFFQRAKDYSRMAEMWSDQQNSLRRLVAQNPNAKLPPGFGGKQNPGLARDYLHDAGQSEGLEGRRKPEQYILYTNDGAQMLGDVGEKGPFLNRLGNFMNHVLSFIPGLRDPQYKNQLQRMQRMQEDAIKTLDYHTRGKLMNPNRQMSDADKRVVNDFLSTFYVTEGLGVNEAKRAAAIMTRMQSDDPGAVDKHMNDAIADGETDPKEILNYVRDRMGVKDDIGEVDFGDAGTEEKEVPEGSKLSYILPEVGHTKGKPYKLEDCEFAQQFLGGEHLQGATKGGKMVNLQPSHYKALRTALEAAKKDVHGNANSHIEGKLPTNPDQSPFDFILNNPGFNSSLDDVSATARNRIKSALQTLSNKEQNERIGPMVGYVLGNSEHIQQVAQERGMDHYDPAQPHTYFTPNPAEQSNPAQNIDLTGSDEVQLSEREPMDLAWSILKGA